mmetsp:Transcript_3784/g.8578  ORF Transcript_3784/g.8578 Transcript_3784/m.8578 type:complete len:242 (-) Transcript_3784:75-800(-)
MFPPLDGSVTYPSFLRENVKGIPMASVSATAWGPFTRVSPSCSQSCESPLDQKNYTCGEKWVDYRCRDLDHFGCSPCKEKVGTFGPCCLTSEQERGTFRQPAVGLLNSYVLRRCRFWADYKYETTYGAKVIGEYEQEGLQYAYSCLLLPKDVEPFKSHSTQQSDGRDGQLQPDLGQCGVFAPFVAKQMPTSMHALLDVGSVECPANEAFVSIQLVDATNSFGEAALGYEFTCAPVQFKQKE